MDRGVLRVERAMIAYGALATLAWWIDRRYLVGTSSSSIWAFGIATSLGQIAVGLLVALNGGQQSRFMNVARYYQIGLILGGFTISHLLATPSAVTANTILAAAALLALLWGTPGKVRTVIGYVALAAMFLRHVIVIAKNV